MIHHGHAITVQMREGGMAQCCFQLEPKTKDDLNDIQAALIAIESNASIQGLIVTFSTPLNDYKNKQDHEVLSIEKTDTELWLKQAHQLLNQFEDLKIPKVALLEPSQFDTAFEISLCCEYRVIDQETWIGLTQHQRGVMPYLGGLFRLPHIVGLDQAIEWILYGNSYTATDALQQFAVDAVVHSDDLLTSAIDILHFSLNNTLNWKDRQQRKRTALPLRDIEKKIVFYSVKDQTLKNFPIHHIPTAHIILNTLQHTIDLDRDEAMARIETVFLNTLNSPTLYSLNHWAQIYNRYQHNIRSSEAKLNTLAWIGDDYHPYLDILFSYQPHLKLILQTSSTTTASLYAELAVQWNHHFSVDHLVTRLEQIQLTTEHQRCQEADLVFDTLVTDLPTKLSVLYGLQQSTTPTYLIELDAHQSMSSLAAPSHYPVHLIGAYFFKNMQTTALVEVVCHEKTSNTAIEKTLNFIQQLGHTPLLVKDQEGRFIHRVLSAYFFAFDQLLQEGISFQQIDQCIEYLGWSHGPAALADLIGIETCLHFHEQLQTNEANAKSHFHLLYEADRLGQNNSKGFYTYQNTDTSLLKQDDANVFALFPAVVSPTPITTQHITDRLTVALCNEVIRCIEDQTILSAIDADVASVLAFGFPKHLGGPCHFIEHLGLPEYIALCNTYEHLGEHYIAPQLIHEAVHHNQSLFLEPSL